MSLGSRVPRRLLFIIAGTLLLAVTAVAWLMLRTPHANFLTAPVRRGDIQVLVQATGKLEAVKSVSVGAQVSGQITALHIANGDRVEKGQLIAEIDDSNQLNELRIAQAALRVFKAQRAAKVAALKKATLAYQRQQRLWRNDASSRKAYEEAETDLAMVRAGIDELDAQIVQANIKVDKEKVNLSYTRVTAPVAGTVVAVIAREGQTVNAVQSAPIIVKLAQLDTMTVKTQISEADITRIAPNQPLFFTIFAEPDHPYHARLRAIEQAPESLNREEDTTHTDSTSNAAVYYNALFDVPNPDHRLRINMTAQVSLIVDDVKDTLLIPAAALTHSEGKGRYTLQVLVKGKPVARQVKIGLNNFVDAQVLSGLQVGEQVILSQDEPLATGV
ncbi:Macrolide export protein MacA [Sodalis glossinidius str. 'morsitans']|uniref:Macrolide export protein MacA n=1 Tax=Sodalis glossinidius (strain morsitans) TaxID=343509 RepID=Q2NSZ2_SODGM|nr:efflux RND transporter periplasmic adaptor subunit [Sodalis glossinidius]BAE74733.1 putative secretion protein [Sodalis glossinidius str. 'morsitans']CRL45512.1 Macrolide export protein MacA [Sodalis glossinidius str. 'morsitans']